MMDVVMRMPDLSTVDDTVKLVRWLAEVGKEIRRGDPLLEVETDKSILVVESAVTGTLRDVDRLSRRGSGDGPADRDVRCRWEPVRRPSRATHRPRRFPRPDRRCRRDRAGSLGAGRRRPDESRG